MEEKRKNKIDITVLRKQQLKRWREVQSKDKQSEAYNTVIHIDMYRKLQSSMDKEIA